MYNVKYNNTSANEIDCSGNLHKSQELEIFSEKILI